MIPELPEKDETPKPSEEPQVPRLSSIRMRLLQSYEAEVLDFVVDRLELGVDEDRIVEQLQAHSFTEDEARRLVQQAASDETLHVTSATELYEKDLLEFVANQLRLESNPQDVVHELLRHDLSEREARRLVDALIADPDLLVRTKEAIEADASLGAFSIFVGLCVFFLGIGFLVGWSLIVDFGYSVWILLIGGGICVILGPFQIVMGTARIINAKTRRAR